MTDDICYPSEDIVVAQIRKVAKELNIKTLFVATDVPAQVSKFSGLLSDLKIKVSELQRYLECLFDKIFINVGVFFQYRFFFLFFFTHTPFFFGGGGGWYFILSMRVVLSRRVFP